LTTVKNCTYENGHKNGSKIFIHSPINFKFCTKSPYMF